MGVELHFLKYHCTKIRIPIYKLDFLIILKFH